METDRSDRGTSRPSSRKSQALRPTLSTTPSQAGHKRSLSGSILSRLAFLRTPSPEETKSPHPLPAPSSFFSSHSAPLSFSSSPAASPLPGSDGQHDHDTARHNQSLDEVPVAPAAGDSAMLLAQRVAKQRNRKGSLRKTALLGTGHLKAEVRERRNSLLQMQRTRSTEDQSGLSSSLPVDQQRQHWQHRHLDQRPHPDLLAQSQAYPPSELPLTYLSTLHAAPVVPPNQHHRHQQQPSQPLGADSSPAFDGTLPNLSLDTAQMAIPSSLPQSAAISMLASPIVSPTSQSYASTTDDEEALILPNSALKRPPIPSSASYFPAPSSIQRRRSSKKPSSPLSAIPVNAYGQDDEHDYSETEWWGWVVLVVTWIVFVVGMGSCFGLWSWAWDVGETPYAPPELEDDPTLPIVGYYPALIILTGVMAWVWVVVAWVGMKYFKHAKMAGE